MNDIEALIERLKAATEPDRQLDVDIATLFGEVTWRQKNYTMEPFPSIAYRTPHPYAGMKEPVREYTASVDAAMTLVPKEYPYWLVSCRDTPLGKMTGEGVVHNGELFMSGERRAWDVFAHTPAIALCIAALKARADK